MRTLIIISSLGLSYALLRGWPEILGAVLAVVVIFTGIVISRKKKEGGGHGFRRVRVAGWLDYLVAGVVLMIIGLMFVLLFIAGPPVGERLLAKLDVYRELAPLPEAGESSRDTENGLPSKLVQGHGNWLWDSSLSRDLPKRTNYQPKNHPDVYLSVSDSQQASRMSSGKIYIHAFALANFDGQRWRMHQPAKRVLHAVEGGIQLRLDEGLVEDLPVYRHRITHSYYHDGQNVFCGLQGASEVALSQLVKIADGIFLLPRKAGEDYLYEYEVKSQPRIFEEIVAQGHELEHGLQADGLDPAYFEKIPDSALREKLKPLLVELEHIPSLKGKLEALQVLLRQRCRYSMQVMNPDNLPPLENFLFGEMRGSCEYFATAAAIMCREMGIPSRIAFGWSGGKFFQSRDLFIFSEADAHAWTEVYLQGYGWTVLDATGSDEVRTESANDDEAPPRPDDAFQQEELDQQEGVAMDGSVAQDTVAGVPFYWVFAGSILVGGVLVLLRSRGAVRALGRRSSRMGAEPDYMDAFRAACGKRGMRMPRGRTLRRQLQLLEKHGGLPDFSEQMLRYHYGVFYQGEPRRPDQEELLLQMVDRWLICTPMREID